MGNPVALLVDCGDEIVAIRFATADEAMDWADKYGIYEAGRPRIVSRAEARRLIRERAER